MFDGSIPVDEDEVSNAAAGKGFRVVRADAAESQHHDCRLLEMCKALFTEHELQAVERRLFLALRHDV
ncbi:hypothetical protein [Atopobium sp. oral taxon 416]|uniref:hypothetical protein n=1 Tax=Atopobium sp. oral taxon 416 TaxID=712157 RepID=UPI001BA85CAA|nr:hypothetical protein [Atopobium sp. oral taxon 416]QUC05030.1 hypothetical protein J4859_11315 [Atopobium sp. oral taxon 416]